MHTVDLGEIKDLRIDENELQTVARVSSIKILNSNYSNPSGFAYGRIICFDAISARQTDIAHKWDEYYLAISSDCRIWVGKRINRETDITWKEK